jgi:hypothetical protein
MNSLTNINLFLCVAEMVQTLSGMSISDVIIAAVVFVLLKGQFNFELKISFGTTTKKEDNDKNKTT